MSERENTDPIAGSPSVELHIEELLLRGFNPHDRLAISDAVERELTRLIVNGGIAGIGAEAAIERLDGGRFKVAQGMRPGAVGRQIAQMLYRGMSPARSVQYNVAKPQAIHNEAKHSALSIQQSAPDHPSGDGRLGRDFRNRAKARR